MPDKQEEIREGIYGIIIKHDYSPLEQFKWERDLVRQIVNYLHSQGVVIKDWGITDEKRTLWAVESLIKEG